jgi:hypothetical protein
VTAAETIYRYDATVHAFRVLRERVGASVTWHDLFGSGAHDDRSRMQWAYSVINRMRAGGLLELVLNHAHGVPAAYTVSADAARISDDLPDYVISAWARSTKETRAPSPFVGLPVQVHVAVGPEAVERVLAGASEPAPPQAEMLAALVMVLPKVVESLGNLVAGVQRVETKLDKLYQELGGGK